MATVINYPQIDVKYLHTSPVYITADNTTVSQYCTLMNLTGSTSYIAETQRFSNDGARMYQYYSGGAWVTEFGFRQIVTQLTLT